MGCCFGVVWQSWVAWVGAEPVRSHQGNLPRCARLAARFTAGGVSARFQAQVWLHAFTAACAPPPARLCLLQTLASSTPGCCPSGQTGSPSTCSRCCRGEWQAGRGSRELVCRLISFTHWGTACVPGPLLLARSLRLPRHSAEAARLTRLWPRTLLPPPPAATRCLTLRRCRHCTLSSPTASSSPPTR